MRPSPAISSERKAFSTDGTRVFAAVPITRVKKPSRVPLATDGGVRAALNPKPETRNPKSETRNPEPETRNPEPKTRTPKPETLNSETATRPLARRSFSRLPHS